MLIEIISAIVTLYLLLFAPMFGAFILLQDFGKNCNTLSCRILRLMIRIYTFNLIRLKNLEQ